MGCAASQPQPPTRTVLEGEGASHPEDGIELADPSRESLAPRGAISIPYRGPDTGGIGYRLILELSGERWTGQPSAEEPAEPLGESHLLELEFTERGADGRADAYLLVLDALHYKL